MSETLIVSITAITISVVSILLSEWRKTKIDAKELENRLMKIENHLLTDKDKDCLQDLNIKMNLLWSVIDKEFPKILKNRNTPEFDLLLHKIIESGLKSLTAEEFAKLKTNLQNEYAKALLIEDKGYAQTIAIYQKALEYQEISSKLFIHGSPFCFLP